MTRRAFVMPVVVLLALVGGLVVGVVMTRASQRAVITQEQIEAYRDTHREFGMKSIITSWINLSRSVSVDDLTGGTGEGGTAFTTELPDGSEIEAGFYPAQASALTEPVGLDPVAARIARRTKSALNAAFGPTNLADVSRGIGPLAVDARRATPRVIETVVGAALRSDDLGAAYAGRLVRERARDGLERSTLNTIADELGLTSEQRELIQRVVTIDPSLWRVRTVYRPAGRNSAGGATETVYEGYVDLPGGSLAVGSAFSPNEVFLSWQRADEPPGYTGN